MDEEKLTTTDALLERIVELLEQLVENTTPADEP